ncbi:M23 family peptidase [Putridiphycobacter roseus]|uniref:M23 family peptidase n=1 Tax=Putridiphycobacter roseus TaxID=2219161 RepID=A0A2W1NIS3_9FLAO|nr:M23 family metallopeptidase [Putridiphycobacter roseus]PZE18943.1 M23 family peptidase [Putridiphycobacter roseus]
MYKLSLLLLGFVFIISCKNESKTKVKEVVEVIDSVLPSPIAYGFTLDSFQIHYDTIVPNSTLSHLFAPYDISQWYINTAAEMAADSSIGLKYVTTGTPVMLLQSKKDTAARLLYCVYPKNEVEYVVFNFTDSVEVSLEVKPHAVEEKILSAEIIANSNLTVAINQQLKNINMTGEMAEEISGLFAWTIDFFKLHPGDQFKVIYNEKSVDGNPYDIGDIKYAYFKHQNKEFYSFYYVLDSAKNKVGVFDENGKEMKRKFLMSPVKYSRISSSYSNRRFHPVQRRWKSHLGTDYAAPKGTPIWSTADGYVIAAAYTRGNGNYVKVKHNDTYTTQYLHMTGFASGIKKGVYVKQGQIIGFVGSTGLATGPHVCYRFWKNGKQINHRTEKFQPSTPMPDSLLQDYLKFIEPIKAKLDQTKITPFIRENK